MAVIALRAFSMFCMVVGSCGAQGKALICALLTVLGRLDHQQTESVGRNAFASVAFCEARLTNVAHLVIVGEV